MTTNNLYSIATYLPSVRCGAPLQPSMRIREHIEKGPQKSVLVLCFGKSTHSKSSVYINTGEPSVPHSHLQHAMFFSEELLRRKTPIGKMWLASHGGMTGTLKMLHRQEIEDFDIASGRPAPPLLFGRTCDDVWLRACCCQRAGASP